MWIEPHQLSSIPAEDNVNYTAAVDNRTSEAPVLHLWGKDHKDTLVVFTEDLEVAGSVFGK